MNGIPEQPFWLTWQSHGHRVRGDHNGGSRSALGCDLLLLLAL
jgi:hypothetical protein